MFKFVYVTNYAYFITINPTSSGETAPMRSCICTWFICCISLGKSECLVCRTCEICQMFLVSRACFAICLPDSSRFNMHPRLGLVQADEVGVALHLFYLKKISKYIPCMYIYNMFIHHMYIYIYVFYVSHVCVNVYIYIYITSMPIQTILYIYILF